MVYHPFFEEPYLKIIKLFFYLKWLGILAAKLMSIMFFLLLAYYLKRQQ